MEVTNKLGRRKKSVARVYLKNGTGSVTINGRDYKEYFPTMPLQYRIHQPFAITETEGKFDVKVNVNGGGITGQIEAVRMGIARALVEIDSEYKTPLKREGLMTRDPRMVERKKYGQPKARKKFQFSKR
ncbi:MAG TPA: 30S ribosomal protein S9 [Cryomorphaceae bacterium]|nr:30S ribosomal protein S9 [Cryomorphaceae bacterium]